MDRTASRLYTIFFGIVILFVSSIYQIPGGIRINLLLYPQIGIYAVLGFFHAFNMMRFKSWNNTCRLQMLGDGNSENKSSTTAFEFLDLISDWLLYTAWYNVILFPLSGFGVIEWIGVFIILICGFISDLSGTTYPFKNDFSINSTETMPSVNSSAYVYEVQPEPQNQQSAEASVVYAENRAQNYYAGNSSSSNMMNGSGAIKSVTNSSVTTTYAETGEPILSDFTPENESLPAVQKDEIPSAQKEQQLQNPNGQNNQSSEKKLRMLRTAWFLGQSPMMLLITGAALYIFKVSVFYLLPANLYLEAFHGNNLARTMIVLFCLLGITALFSLLKKNMQATISKKTQEKIVETTKKAGNKVITGIKNFFGKLAKAVSAKAFLIICLIAVFAVILIAGAFALNIYNKILDFIEPFMEQLLKNGKTVIIPSKLYGVCQTISLIAILFSAALTAHNVTKYNRHKNGEE